MFKCCLNFASLIVYLRRTGFNHFVDWFRWQDANFPFIEKQEVSLNPMKLYFPSGNPV